MEEKITDHKPANERAGLPSSSACLPQSNKTHYDLRLLFFRSDCGVTHFFPPLQWEMKGVGWGGQGVTLTLEVVGLRPHDSPAGALGAEKGSTSRKDTLQLS